jgi:hypothetical protein
MCENLRYMDFGSGGTNWYFEYQLVLAQKYRRGVGSGRVGGHVRVNSNVRYGVAHHISGGLHRGFMIMPPN